MDILLLKDVDRLGREGAVVKVKPGYARNYLVPRGLAVAATKDNMRALEEQQRQIAVRVARRRKQMETVKATLERLTLTMPLASGEQDAPFGSVTVHDLLQALQQQGVTVIEKAMIQLVEPIKTFGTVGVPVRLHPDVTATVSVDVVKAS